MFQGIVKGKSCIFQLINGDLTSSFSHKGYKPFRYQKIGTSASMETSLPRWLDMMIKTIQDVSYFISI